MDKCPICNFPETDDLQAILERIDTPDLLVTLACDFAERVCEKTSNPAQSHTWLKAARDWRIDRVAANEAERAAWAAAANASVKKLAANAVWYATLAATSIQSPKADHATIAASKAMGALGSHEREWQLDHTRELACACIALATGPEGARSRNSLLAS